MANIADPDQLKKPSDLDLHCLQRQDIFRFNRTRVNNLQCQYQLYMELLRVGIYHTKTSYKTEVKKKMIPEYCLQNSGQDK